MSTGTVIRQMREAEYPLLEDFLYEAIFIPEDFDGEIPRSIIREPELAAFIEGFGTLPDDHCLVAEVEGAVVGAAWARIVRTYGHVDDTTPLLSISLLPEHRGRGIGTALMDRLLDHLRALGHQRASLSVQKANPALRLYRRAGFVDHREEGDELIMIKDLTGGENVPTSLRRSSRPSKPDNVGDCATWAVAQTDCWGEDGPYGSFLPL